MQNVKLTTAIGPIEIKKRNEKVFSLKLSKNPPPSPPPAPRPARRTDCTLAGVLRRAGNPPRRDRMKGYENLFMLVPDLSMGTPFQQKVWRYIRKIPYGHTVTYKKIAEELGLGRAYRAIGQACKCNPMPIIIPCHRVVATNGTLGGYSAGSEWKKFLLELEKGRI